MEERRTRKASGEKYRKEKKEQVIAQGALLPVSFSPFYKLSILQIMKPALGTWPDPFAVYLYLFVSNFPSEIASYFLKEP